MAFIKGRVVNKRARWNLCFADCDQEPDYENKRGRIVDFKNIHSQRSSGKSLRR